MNRAIALAALAAAVFVCSARAVPTLILNPPDGAVQGAPGETVGWGYTFVNDTPFYLLVVGSDFCQPGQDPFFSTCTQLIGTYNDYIASNGTVIPPMSSPSQDFSPGNPGTGVGGYTIDTNPPASMDVGNIYVIFDEFNGDPFNGGMQVSGDMEVFSAASVTVVPEPATFGLGGLALAAIAGLRFRRMRRRS